MSWGTRTFGGTAYDLCHLDPFVVETTHTGQLLRVYVSFGCHTFAREQRPGDAPDLLIVDGSDTRCFCPERFEHSKNLKRIIEYTSAGRVFFSEGRNMLCVDWLPDLEAPYAVYFNLKRARLNGVNATMFVVSAYEKPELPPRLPAMKFSTLVDQVSKGRPIVRPTELRSIKR